MMLAMDFGMEGLRLVEPTPRREVLALAISQDMVF